MKHGEDEQWENGVRGAVVSATEHRLACAGFSTAVLAVAKASAEPLLTVTHSKSEPKELPQGPKKHQKVPNQKAP